MVAHPAGGGLHSDPASAARRLARAWAQAVAGTSFMPMDRPALVTFLRDLAAQLLGTLTAEAFDRAVPRRVGAALVEAHFTEAGSIESTLALLGCELASVVPTPAGRK